MSSFLFISDVRKKEKNMIYTVKKWEDDKTFKATPGQEIEEKIYIQILNDTQPKYLSSNVIQRVSKKFGIAITCGFLMGEAYDWNKDTGNLYLAFGKNNGKFYYLGLSN